jgi:hypothetical protein
MTRDLQDRGTTHGNDISLRKQQGTLRGSGLFRCNQEHSRSQHQSNRFTTHLQCLVPTLQHQSKRVGPSRVPGKLVRVIKPRLCLAHAEGHAGDGLAGLPVAAKGGRQQPVGVVTVVLARRKRGPQGRGPNV